jgi:hypothetical protein
LSRPFLPFQVLIRDGAAATGGSVWIVLLLQGDPPRTNDGTI